VDAVVGRAASIVDAVHEKVAGMKSAADAAKDAASDPKQAVKDAMDGASATAEEWLAAARDMVKANPLAAIGGALLIGAAWVSLTRRR
jgi:ElaB/YqjD/DUF883 family membrane-anchored ribosome-binding protein